MKKSCCNSLGELLKPPFFKALCDPNRITLLDRLVECNKPCSVSEIAHCCPVDFSVVSRHLVILRDAGILQSEKKGKEVYYSVECKSIVNSLREIADTIESCCMEKEKK